jgi:WD40 repeat protein
VRAFLNRHDDMLQDPSRWPVPHFVQQLAAQEPDSTFARASGAVKADSTMMGEIIEWVKRPRVQHPLRLTLNNMSLVEALAWSPEGARLAQAVANNVVVRDSTTGFTLSTLRVDAGYGVQCVTFNGTGDTIVAGCWNGNIFFIDTATSQVREPPLTCDRYDAIVLQNDWPVCGH